MAFFQKKRRTSQQKAQRAQMGILARLLGCAYLIYIMVQLIQTTRSEENATDVTLKIAIAVFFLLASAVIIAITAVEFVRSSKAGFYKASFYTDDFAADGAEASESDGDAPGIEDGTDDDGEAADSIDSSDEEYVDDEEECDEDYEEDGEEQE